MKYPLSYVCTFFASNWASISTIAMHWRRQLHYTEIDFSLHLQSLVVSDPRVHQTMPPVPLGVIDRSSRCSPLPSGLRLLVPGGGASYRHNSFSGSRHALRLADGSSPGSRHNDLTHSCITWELQCACGTYFVRARPPVSVD